MPYITQERRLELIQEDSLPETPGELNFVISDTIDSYLCAQGISYGTLNTVIGVLACVQAEVYRRIAAAYEDVRLEQHGEVFFSVAPDPPQ